MPKFDVISTKNTFNTCSHCPDHPNEEYESFDKLVEHCKRCQYFVRARKSTCKCSRDKIYCAYNNQNN